VLIMDTLWKTYLNFVKDAPMTYVNLVIPVIIVSEKKKGGRGITFVLVSHLRRSTSRLLATTFSTWALPSSAKMPLI
jgi:hypothetical protein